MYTFFKSRFMWMKGILLLVCLSIVLLICLRAWDFAQDRREWSLLLRTNLSTKSTFDPNTYGFLWIARFSGIIPISGSDSSKWSRFRILELLPVARAKWNEDYEKAAFGRYAAECLFWSPAAALPSKNVLWSQIGPNQAKITFLKGNLSQDVYLEVDDSGKPLSVSFLRWSNANPSKKFQWQPFGGTLSDFREVSGYTIPFQVNAANFYGTAEQHFFFKAKLTEWKIHGEGEPK